MDNTVVAKLVPWDQVCRMLDKIQGTSRNKKDMLLKFILQYKDLLKKNKEKYSQAEDSFFPVMRLLLPSLDRERGAYGVKERKLADLYIKILGLKKDGIDAQKLLNYKKPKSGGGGVGDFADVAFYVLKNRCPEKGTLTLYEVDKNLTMIAESYITKDHGVMEKALLQMLRKMTANEQKWLIRILLKEMHLGIGENVIFSAWHPDAKDFYDVNNSLLKVCNTLIDTDTRLHEIEVSLFCPFRPMRAERVILDKIESQMKHKAFYSETKFDGERSQIHKSGRTYKYFSRNGFDFSSNFGCDPYNGLFTPHIHPLFNSIVENVILDGEMVAWSQKYKTIINKGEHLDVKHLKEGGDWQVCFCAFDILYLNGKVLSNLPLKERLNILKDVIRPLEGRIIMTERIIVKSKQDVVNALNAAIDDREEGLVLKDPDSAYAPASRKAGWIKVKPDYVDSLVPELDLVIIGGYYGTGKLQGVVAHFLLAVAAPETNKDSHPTVFHSVCKVHSGFTVAELEILLAKLSNHWTRNQPLNVTVAKEKPDVWINPKNSSVLQVRCAELMKSDHYKTGVSLRFPRVDEVRSDKSWYDILTSVELDELMQEGAGKFTAKYLLNEEENREGPPKKKMLKASHHPCLPEFFRPADISKVDKKIDLFFGKEFCVIGGGNGMTKQQLEKLVAEHGGTLTQHPSRKSFIVISDSRSIKVQNIISSSLHNILRPSWLSRCAKEARICSFNPLEVIHLLPKEEEEMKKEFDVYGDSFHEMVDGPKLKAVMDAMTDHKNWRELNVNEMRELDQLTVDPCSMRGFFRQVIAYFLADSFERERENNQKELSALKLILHGGSIRSILDEEITHIIIPESLSAAVKRSDYPGKRLVTPTWIQKSLRAGKLLPEKVLF